MNADFYEDITENTSEALKKMRKYVDLALELGDSVHIEGGNKVIITILKRKKE